MEVKIKSIKDRLSPRTRGIMDECLPKINSTVTSIVTCPSCHARFAADAVKTSESRACLFFSRLIDPEDGEVGDKDIQRFERLINYLIKNRLVAYGVLMDPMSMPLSNGNFVLMWYVYSDYTRKELNDQLGCNCFVGEGELNDGKWPQVAIEGAD